MTFLDEDLRKAYTKALYLYLGFGFKRIPFAVVDGIAQVDENKELAIQYVRHRR